MNPIVAHRPRHPQFVAASYADGLRLNPRFPPANAHSTALRPRFAGLNGLSNRGNAQPHLVTIQIYERGPGFAPSILTFRCAFPAH